MERKSKTGLSALLIVGSVFTIVGAAFLAIGLIIYCALKEEEGVILFLLIFGGIGLLFFILGLIFLIVVAQKKIRSDKLLNSGNYVMAEISEVDLNYNVTINRRHPYIVRCRYQDRYGNVHIFKSRDLLFDPTDLFKDQMVRVYVEGENYKHYYVDIDEVLPNVIEH
ncbi:MAG: hypothetical protein ACI4SD_01215 [Suilimivivens sp.]